MCGAQQTQLELYLICHIYIALFLCTQSALHMEGRISSTTAIVQHQSGWWDDSHIAPERPPHTSLLVERRQSDEANHYIWGWLGGHDGQRPMGKFGQDAMG